MQVSTKSKVIFFVTSNIHKFNEARKVFTEYGFATAMLNLSVAEIQDDDLENIAKASVIEASKKSKLPVIVEDSGLFIKPLKGFPGPYSSYIHQTIGNKGILKLMDKKNQRDAFFLSIVAFSSREQRKPVCFEGKVEGKISSRESGRREFGFDPIFEPGGTIGKTFAEMTIYQKNEYSHRAQALRKFAYWYRLHFL
jgi:XTP/dITP diphosphohydrolase